MRKWNVTVGMYGVTVMILYGYSLKILLRDIPFLLIKID